MNQLLWARLLQLIFDELVAHQEWRHQHTSGEKLGNRPRPAEAKSFGFMEAPRGSFDHLVRIKDGRSKTTRPSSQRGTARRATRMA
jgi:Ni,Fe-hydrogenase I large subunit